MSGFGFGFGFSPLGALLNQWGPTITVGVGKDYSTIAAAVAAASDLNIIMIDAGTYNEHIAITDKRLKFIGSGNRETIIYYNVGAQTTFSPISITTDCEFENIIIDKREYYAGLAKPMIDINGCNPIFRNAQLGRSNFVDEYTHQNPMLIYNASNVVMIDCDVFGNKMDGTTPYDLVVSDTSTLNFEGTHLFCRIVLNNSATATIIADYIYSGSSATALGFRLNNSSSADITVRIREIYWSQITKSEYVAGLYSAETFRLYTTGNFTLTGLQITGSIRINGDNTVLLKNVTNTLGRFWVVTEGAATAAGSITFDNCQIKMDLNDDTTGSHIIEEVKGKPVNLINGTVLEFTGHTGNWFTMGSPISCKGKLTMRNSTVIDNCNDNAPYGVNYQAAMYGMSEIDLEDAIITNQNWDGLGKNNCIQLKKGTGNIKVRLKNVTLNNSETNGWAIFQATTVASYPSTDDYICRENVTFNSTGLFFQDSNANGNTALAQLESHCPL